MENFNENQTHEIDGQKKLIKDLGKKVIDTNSNSSAGLWTYGNVNQAKKFGDVFDDMVCNFSSFALKAEDLFCFGEERSPPGGENLIDHINQAGDKYNVANCLLFLTGSKEEKPVWKIDPIYDYNRIVIISLQGSEPTEPPEAFNGTSSTMITTRVQSTTAFIHPSVSTSSQTKFFINTTKTLHSTTTRKSTQKPTAPIHCMFVGDVFNLSNDTTTSPINYEDERAMLDQAGELLLEKRGNTAGIWAYGHVNHTDNF
ncbi:unnamed protein product [Cylicocyclus nassatus]|uniref:Uncharacterized protein n=1 Tax=Cylicocyclus nassatus TaxID=53992 RepID=A0AA36MCH7_CYLNA|nr:unnamed protein product [Cylicocyclus nassatus]